MSSDYSLALFLFFIAFLVLLVYLLGRSFKSQRRKEARAEHDVQKGVPDIDKDEVKAGVISKEGVKAVLIQRIEGIKKRDARSISGLVDRERYTKFDDWPPFERQDLEAISREADALKVLKEYDYETDDWKIEIFGDEALASFIINYRGTIRNVKFNIRSRITAFLVRRDENWKLVHEHWSRFPN